MNLFSAFMELDRLNEDLIYCWFGYYLDKDGKKKLIYATKDSTSYDGDEGAEKLEDMIPEPYTKFVFRGSITNRQAERAGYTLVEGIFDKPSTSSWVSTKTGQKISSNNTTQPAQTSQPSNGKYVVTIVSHGGRLRALATDGTNPAAWVAFPNDLRTVEGQKYEVDQLIWNGKNYRVAGNIVKI